MNVKKMKWTEHVKRLKEKGITEYAEVWGSSKAGERTDGGLFVFNMSTGFCFDIHFEHGKYAIYDHGNLVKELTPEEFRKKLLQL